MSQITYSTLCCLFPPQLYRYRHRRTIPLEFWPCIDSNITDTFKAQKGSKKIIYVTSVVHNFMKLREYKNNKFIQQFILFRVSFQHAFAWYSRECASTNKKRRNWWIINIFLTASWKWTTHVTWTILTVFLLRFWVLNLVVVMISRVRKLLDFINNF